jgi:hypothetical protein
MTVEQLTLLSVGVLVNGLTFALGLLSGASLRKKETRHDSDSNSTGKAPKGKGGPNDYDWWHTPQR